MGSSFFEGNDYENDDFPDMANSPFFGSDRAGRQGDFGTGLNRHSLLPGRSSDIRPYNSPFEERDATFVFTVPQPEIPVQPEFSPSPEITQTGGPSMDGPSSPPGGVVKKHALTFARNGASKGENLSRDALDAVMQATDWFFEQISDDLGTYSEHAGRKTIDESDVLMLMRRQRQINATTTPFSLAQSRLPRELLQDVRMIPPLISRDRPRKKSPGK
ncbi:hypothetical protein DID88_008527 [Monilinia fructigena]|uniref:CENP-T/Histone H4 histone fold domain-containing protein n=1 Tax=Monilinia fructigena TaxID=38457 RepID=A0A395J5R7_9HELO|nr:hypothetical protein DID88_008527 [Monilinia fructigena]